MGILKSFRAAALSLCAISSLLVGCSNPLSYEVATLTDEQRTEAWKMLPVDQSEKLDGWIKRNSMNGKALPHGVSVEQAISDQTAWLALREIDEARADEKRRNVEAARAAKQEAMAKMLIVSIASKKNKVQADGKQVVTLEIKYENRTDKDIRGVKGRFKVGDIYGHAISDIDWSYEGGVPANGASVEHDAVLTIDKSNESQESLWDTDFAKLQAEFAFNSIKFKDGTSVDAHE
jgi:hypothetical protein